ncbi:hypothetical protein OTSGILL_2529 [Orientia tsutsugamushi str. Gilliam]|uniref:Uncharacterized protein n=3 Tax=Orientia tsutsugamushi TaxID=784 RepID=A0A0F3M925_ORITS|nr:hypothetical protein OTSGILL_2529 [Orientia tsutsugamushi str. Gilliam]KJV54626.1 hypothetical protein OTSKATO_0991 [Orientia tsutsugamushi str. Kato PP]KJV54946.1 hypothetical protein OTSKARP_0924 [Orientia tsutsugamushi str. Karp]KJW07090.1 hypothetical protein OTUT144_0863 [Orientia tsutsugamushi str. UT144]SPM44791.1 Uncharacterised protein [Orientia tsutsugamushi]
MAKLFSRNYNEYHIINNVSRETLFINHFVIISYTIVKVNANYEL